VTDAANRATTDVGGWLASNPAGWALIGLVGLWALSKGADVAEAVG